MKHILIVFNLSNRNEQKIKNSIKKKYPKYGAKKIKDLI